MFLCRLTVRRGRIRLSQSDESDDEEKHPSPFCSRCGSARRYAGADNCTRQRKLGRLKAVFGWIANEAQEGIDEHLKRAGDDGEPLPDVENHAMAGPHTHAEARGRLAHFRRIMDRQLSFWEMERGERAGFRRSLRRRNWQCSC